MNRIAIAAIVLSISAAAVHAQSEPMRAVCWRTVAFDRCSTIFLSELTYQRPLIASQRSLIISDPRTGATAEERNVPGLTGTVLLELGLLDVRTPRLAIGPAFQVGVSGSGGQLRAGVRARTMRSDRFGFDTRIAVVHGEVGQSFDNAEDLPAGTGVGLEARALVGDMLSIGLSYDDLSWPDYAPGGTHSFRGGGRARSLAATASIGGDEALLGAAILVAGTAMLVFMITRPCGGFGDVIELGPLHIGAGAAARACEPPPGAGSGRR